MKNKFDVKLSQFTNIQRDQQYQHEIFVLNRRNYSRKELRRELNKLEETMNLNKTEIKKLKKETNEMTNEFKKQLEDLKQKDSTRDSRSGYSIVASGNDELSYPER
eukprot:CAMPEP_0178940986 /NCGR_PEP_ID=MMETSP0789-20121207/1131_1 /TAXON_ID=3005 /ORGANISM="Rhizosolenia setigera, Strain CCMP 1694" /LENGTH=105 /DNA_ID=CAMNT_0020620121 /DNA_START=81 /DNA_END=399 /DNA_ORIENTATION=-